MPIANALLTRWVGGYLEVVNATSVTAWGRREALLQLGSITTVEEATRVSQGLMVFTSDPRVATSMGILPRGDTDQPFTNYDLGDTIVAPDEGGADTAQRVVSITVAEDDNGEISFAQELKDTMLVQEEQFNRWLKLLLAGTLRGTARNAQPVTPPPTTNG